MVLLSKGHIIISKDIVNKLWGEVSNIHWVYDKKQNIISLSIIPSSKQPHKVKTSMLKFKNIHGDRSISIQELILDNEINNTDRQLKYTLNEESKILIVEIG